MVFMALITTQVVEAGVDIDMDLGFKDTSLIDSDEQLAGRINRNVNKKDCVLHLFNYNRANPIYGKDKRYVNTKELTKEAYLEILRNKDFNKIYDKIIEGIETWNIKPGAIGFDDYEQHIKKLRFQSVHFDFALIDKEQKNITVFIPLNIPVWVAGISGDKDAVFSENEIVFLAKNDIMPDNENKIEGWKVFDLYLRLLDQKGDITDKKIANRIMQGIMSKFIVQVFGSNNMERKLVEFTDVEKSDKGYVYLSGWERIYNENTGINDGGFDYIDEQFL